MIGIVTPYKISNYGTKLQAYAMQQLMGKYDEAELLGFISASDRRICAVLGKVYLKITRRFQKKAHPSETEEQKTRLRAINTFDSYYRFGNIVKGNSALTKELKRYDAIVCGSDQLWAPSNVLADYFTLTIIPEAMKRFSYAASFGVSEIPFLLRGKYRSFLSKLDDISVREEQGKKIVKEVAFRDSEVVLDPTLMLEPEEWIEVSRRSSIQEERPYLFCYFLGTASEHRSFAKKLARKQNLKLVTIPHFKRWNLADENFGDEQIYDAGPSEFLNLIRHAEYVCTDSFHGTVFSIIFMRRFAVFERFKKNSAESTNSRIYHLLNSLGLEEQLFQDESDVDTFLHTNYDYKKIFSHLNNRKAESFRYLDRVLGKQR